MSNQPPEQLPMGFDTATAIFMARASDAVYDMPPGTLLQFTNEFRFEHPGCEIHVIPSALTDSLCLTIESGDVLYVIFRGTRSLKNLITDLEAEIIPIGYPKFILPVPDTKVHRGFQIALDSLWPDLLPIINAYVYNAQIIPHKIIISGHSLGAGIGAECAGYIWEKFRFSPIGYTFGQPRVGNAAWRKFFEFAFPDWFRMVHCNDVVCRIPAILRLYRQTGIEMFFDNADALHVDWPWWKKLPSDIRGICRHRWIDVDVLLADHHMDSYVKLLERKWAR